MTKDDRSGKCTKVLTQDEENF